MTLGRRLIGEPLIQFLLIGSAVAGLYALSSPDEAPSAALAPYAIEVSEGDVEQLREQFRRTWRRPPAEEELRGLIDAFVREEILYRAGRELGLDEDDPVVRRRVAQKMEFLLEPGPGSPPQGRRYGWSLGRRAPSRRGWRDGLPAARQAFHRVLPFANILAFVLVFAGEVDRAAALIDEAKRFNPSYPVWYRRPSGMIHYFRGDYAAAAEYFQAWRDAEPRAWGEGSLWLAAAQAMDGRTPAAHETIAPQRQAYPYSTTRSMSRWLRFADPEMWEAFERGLLAAGIPPE